MQDKTLQTDIASENSSDLLPDDLNSCWHNRKLDFIPPYLLKRLHEISPCTLIEPHSTDIFEYSEEIYKTSKLSGSFSLVAAGLYPTFPKTFLDMIYNGVKLSVILDPCLFTKLRRDNYELLQHLVNCKQITWYLYPHKIPVFSFVVNDLCLLFRPLTNEGTYDSRQILCKGPSAVKWGKDLIEYYLNGSKLINEI